MKAKINRRLFKTLQTLEKKREKMTEEEYREELIKGVERDLKNITLDDFKEAYDEANEIGNKDE